MTRKQDSANRINWKEVVAEQEDFLRPLIQEIIQQVLEGRWRRRLAPVRESARRTARIPGRLLRPDADHTSRQAGAASAARPSGTVSNGSIRALPTK